MGALRGAVLTGLAYPSQFEQVLSLVGPDDVARAVSLGPDPEEHLAAIGRFADADFDTIYLHQIGPDQDSFFRFCQQSLLPAAAELLVGGPPRHRLLR